MPAPPGGGGRATLENQAARIRASRPRPAHERMSQKLSGARRRARQVMTLIEVLPASKPLW
jgi:hypothetical protein